MEEEKHHKISKMDTTRKERTWQTERGMEKDG
jgi:hypothetical protein